MQVNVNGNYIEIIGKNHGNGKYGKRILIHVNEKDNADSYNIDLLSGNVRGGLSRIPTIKIYNDMIVLEGLGGVKQILN